MPSLDELDALCTYLDDRDMYHKCLYRGGGKVVITPKALRPSPCIWIVRDGKPVNFNQLETKGEKEDE
jgi:hypothetical protein